MGVTIQDVAKEAGVGVGTVSRVLNDSPLVSAETRERVEEVIDRLDYRPSAVARALSLGQSNDIAVVAPFITTPSVVQRLRGVSEVIHRAERELVLHDVETPEQRDDRLERIVSIHRAAGVLVFSLAPDPKTMERLRAAKVPVVFCDRRVEGSSNVWIDDVAAGRDAAQHLIDLGHTRIGFVGDRFHGAFGLTASTDRAEGYRLAMEQAGLEAPPEYLAIGDPGREAAHRLTDQLLGLDPPPTAIIAAYDLLALGVIEAAGAAGRVVPADLSVVGFDDIEVAGYVGLTTVRQPLRESGEIAARLLVETLDGGRTEPESVHLDTEIVIRSTSVPPK